MCANMLISIKVNINSPSFKHIVQSSTLGNIRLVKICDQLSKEWVKNRSKNDEKIV